jgi:hypothetical protein
MLAMVCSGFRSLSPVGLLINSDEARPHSAIGNRAASNPGQLAGG